jgi:hypothetical protein
MALNNNDSICGSGFFSAALNKHKTSSSNDSIPCVSRGIYTAPSEQFDAPSNNDETSEYDFQKLFDKEDQERIYKLIKRMKNLVPLNTQDNIKYLGDLIDYVEGMIHGDDITEYTTFTYLSKYAQNALISLIRSSYDGEIKSLLEERKSLESTVGKLQGKKTSLSSDVASLTSERKTLQGETSKLRLELDSINSELQDKKENATKEVEEAIRIKKAEMGRLSSEVDALKQKVQEYLNLIEGLSRNDKVKWEVVTKKHPIYNLNSETISGYIKSQKQKYAQEMNVSLKDAEKEFEINAPELEVLEELVQAFDYDYSSDYECSTISSIISPNNIKLMDSDDEHKAKSIKAILQNLRLPVYIKTFSPVDDKKEDAPSDVDSLIRELYYERIAVEALSKQRIAETELKAVVELLKRVIPEGTDLKALAAKYLNHDEFLSQISSSTGSIDDAIGTTGFTK